MPQAITNQILDPVPVKTLFEDTLTDSGISWSWLRWLQRTQQLVNSLFPVQPPVSAVAPGNPGQWSYDNGHYYICVAKNTWRRSVIAPW